MPDNSDEPWRLSTSHLLSASCLRSLLLFVVGYQDRTSSSITWNTCEGLGTSPHVFHQQTALRVLPNLTRLSTNIEACRPYESITNANTWCTSLRQPQHGFDYPHRQRGREIAGLLAVYWGTAPEPAGSPWKTAVQEEVSCPTHFRS